MASGYDTNPMFHPEFGAAPLGPHDQSRPSYDEWLGISGVMPCGPAGLIAIINIFTPGVCGSTGGLVGTCVGASLFFIWLGFFVRRLTEAE
jgi:hypothetical protein